MARLADELALRDSQILALHTELDILRRMRVSGFPGLQTSSADMARRWRSGYGVQPGVVYSWVWCTAGCGVQLGAVHSQAGMLPTVPTFCGADIRPLGRCAGGSRHASHGQLLCWRAALTVQACCQACSAGCAHFWQPVPRCSSPGFTRFGFLGCRREANGQLLMCVRAESRNRIETQKKERTRCTF